MSLMGQSRRFGDVRVASALPLKADIQREGRHVSKVPKTDSCRSATAALFDHLVGAEQQAGGEFQSDNFGGFQTYREIETAGLLDRQITCLGALDNPVHIG